MINLKESNAPQRKYLRKDMDKILDKQVKIQSTLLEYGQQNVLLSNLAAQQEQQKQQQQNQASKTAIKQSQNNQGGQVEQASIEQANLKKIMNEMCAADNKQNKINANAVGQILGLQQSALQQIVSDYTNKVNYSFSNIEHNIVCLCWLFLIIGK